MYIRVFVRALLPGGPLERCKPVARLAFLVLLASAALLLAGCGGGKQQHHVAVKAKVGTQHRLPTGQYECLTPHGWVPHACGFGSPPAGQRFPRLSRPSLTGTAEQFDTVTTSTVPSGSRYLAGYTAGFWPTYGPLLGLPWHPSVISIAIGAGYHAMCLDVEPGDAQPWQAPFWVTHDTGVTFKGGRPCVYSSYWEMFNQVVFSLDHAGVSRSRYFIWDADYRYRPGIDDRRGACTQWTDHAFGRNLDQSTCTLDFLGYHPKPPPPPDTFALFPNAPVKVPWGTMRERQFAEQIDGALQHPQRYASYLRVLEPRANYAAARVAWLASHVWGTSTHPNWSFHQRGVMPAGSRRAYLDHAAHGRRISR